MSKEAQMKPGLSSNFYAILTRAHVWIAGGHSSDDKVLEPLSFERAVSKTSQNSVIYSSCSKPISHGNEKLKFVTQLNLDLCLPIQTKLLVLKAWLSFASLSTIFPPRRSQQHLISQQSCSLHFNYIEHCVILVEKHRTLNPARVEVQRLSRESP